MASTTPTVAATLRERLGTRYTRRLRGPAPRRTAPLPRRPTCRPPPSHRLPPRPPLPAPDAGAP